jgi:hypothetical protein
MKVDGHCHCERIRFEAEIDPDKVSICHCTDCQTLTGTVYRTSVPAPAASFVWLAGTPKIYVKIADSGTKRAQAFCGDCGSPIYASDVENPQIYSIRTGALVQRTDLPAKHQIWVHSALPWAMDLKHLPRREGP